MTDAAGALPIRKHLDAPSLIGRAIALGGAALSIIALTFSLPYRDPESIRRAYFHLDEILEHPEGTTAATAYIESRLLVESPLGLLFIVIAVSCAVSVFIAYRGRRETAGPMIAGAVSVFAAIMAGLAADAYGGRPFSLNPGTVGAGLGVYAQLGAGLLMLVGGLLILRSPVWTLVVVSVLVASSTWWLAGRSEPLSPYSDMLVRHAPGQTLSYYSNYMVSSCRALGVERTAMRFGVAPTAEDAARAIAGPKDRLWGDAVYEACLRGFRSGR